MDGDMDIVTDSMDLSKSFIRQLECCSSTLQIHQAEIGDVGCVVWDAALVLAKYLELGHEKGSEDINGKKVIELGAGTGIVGLCAAIIGANVVITDLPQFLPLMQLNIDNNKSSIHSGHIEASVLSWNDEIDKLLPLPDYLIMSDVIYYEEDMQRDFRIKEIRQEDLDDVYRSDDIHVLRLKRK
ncbi:uncharacterized protein TRIADDRAFT_58173 [Trichoplax adhaerens]|uniref:Methyltransferase small domain-containing protein n=1 Tax=Trichoplax adhaerens TaxID=10228 RepID=B3S127_TRIAD|nr:hypothetical protein TRIADDRAFT_58173 [Trichoplax adhaerens]EDV23494.1 hypothetical protein TRIADDRAFT_58173 [Trichoplax adhaerens]|eukprot:XP_002114404.1 hypothetical protein TRIADDRAFT_58173 [Trichoplax adhaerens]